MPKRACRNVVDLLSSVRFMRVVEKSHALVDVALVEELPRLLLLTGSQDVFEAVRLRDRERLVVVRLIVPVLVTKV